MRLAIATEKGKVSAHFGQCEKFTIVDIENENVVEIRELACPEHDCESLPRFLGEKGVQLVVAGGIGMKPMMNFSTKGIQVIPGIIGRTDEVIARYIEGELLPGKNTCEDKGKNHNGDHCSHGGQGK